MKLNALNENGVEFQLLAPFFEALLPAFEDEAAELRIEPASLGLNLTYSGKSLAVPLPNSPRNYASVAFPRILILCGMSIALEGTEQTGALRVRFGQQVIPLQVASQRGDGGWYLVFRPAWKQAQPVHEDHECPT